MDFPLFILFLGGKKLHHIQYERLSVRKIKTLVIRAGIFKQPMGARNRVGIGLSYRPAKLHRLPEFIP